MSNHYIAVKTADTSYTTTTLTNDPHLAVTVDEDLFMFFTGWIIIEGGFSYPNLRWTIPFTSGLAWTVMSASDDGVSYKTLPQRGISIDSDLRAFYIYGEVRSTFAASPVTFQLQFSQESSSANDPIVKSGSWIHLVEFDSA